MPSQRRNSSSSPNPSTPNADLQWLQLKFKSLAPLDGSKPSTVPGCPRPLPNSYWATPLLVACEYPWSPKDPNKPKLDDLLRVGVRTFIDLTEDGELLPYESILCKRATILGIDPSTIEYHRFPIRDRCLPKSNDLLDRVFETLRDDERRGRISAIHCRGGIGRTGLVVGCWLAECGIAQDGLDALRIIATEWRNVEKCKRYPHSPETGPQFDYVANFCPTASRSKDLPVSETVALSA